MAVTMVAWQAVELEQTSDGVVIVRAPTHTVMAHDIAAWLDPDVFHMNGEHFALHGLG